VIVVDDASTDGTVEFLTRFESEHPSLRLRWLRHDQHRGANPSRNRGIRASEAPIVAFLDSDCIAEPQWLAELLRPFEDAAVGACVGLVKDPPPRNIYELTFRGTHRVVGEEARRLVAGNMAVRRELLLKYMLDEDRAPSEASGGSLPDLTVSGRGDEEGLHLMLSADGWRVATAPAAAVMHEHYYTRASFFKQALKGGRSAAKLVYKYRLPPRKDMLLFVLGYVTIPLGLIGPWLLVVPFGFLGLALMAITYNDLALKGKTPAETVRSFPMLVAYYHVRLWGYVTESLRLRLTKHTLQRVSIPQPKRTEAG